MDAPQSSKIGHGFGGIAIAPALDLDSGRTSLALAKFLGGQFDVSGAQIFLEPVQLPSPGDRDDPGLLRQQPGRAIWPGVAPLRCAILDKRSTTAWFWSSASGVNRGMVLRMSLLASKLVEALTVPVRKPLPSGL
jgi:hypothetical protein